MKSGFKLPERARRILINLREALITEPADLVIHDKDAAMMARAEMLLKEFQPLFRFFFLLGIYFFDRCTFLFGFGLKRFVNMTLDKRKDYAEYWLSGRFTVCRDLITGMRGIVMITYFSHHDVWRYIGYDPAAHARERIALRQEIIKHPTKT